MDVEESWYIPGGLQEGALGRPAVIARLFLTSTGQLAVQALVHAT